MEIVTKLIMETKIGPERNKHKDEDSYSDIETERQTGI